MRRTMIAAAASVTISIVAAAPGGEQYQRAGSVADMPFGSSGTQGVATILDERTIRVHALSYNGNAPLVFFYLGETNTFIDFLNGIPIGPELHQMSDDCITVQLPEGQSLDGWGAISIWCAALDVLFTSAAFETTAEPFCPADLDASGAVDFGDVLTVLGAWGACPAEPPDCCYPDLDFSRSVDFADLLAILGSWGACE